MGQLCIRGPCQADKAELDGLIPFPSGGHGSRVGVGVPGKDIVCLLLLSLTRQDRTLPSRHGCSDPRDTECGLQFIITHFLPRRLRLRVLKQGSALKLSSTKSVFLTESYSYTPVFSTHPNSRVSGCFTDSASSRRRQSTDLKWSALCLEQSSARNI